MDKEVRELIRRLGISCYSFVLCWYDPYKHTIHPYAIVKMDRDLFDELVSIPHKDRAQRIYMLAELLHEKYPEEFPPYWDEYNWRTLYWYNHHVAPIEDVCEDVKEQIMKELDRAYSYDDEEVLEEEARELAFEEFEKLPVYKV